MVRTKLTAMLAAAICASLATHADAQTGKVIGDPYPLDTCAVAGSKLGSMGDPVIYVHEGREVKFCCAGCVGKFEAEPAKYLKAVDAKIIKDQKKFYPLETCIVMGDEPLTGPDGDAEPTDIVYNNRLVRLCCGGCKRGFDKDPAAYIKKLDEAVIAKQLKDYPLEKCPIGGPLGSMGEPVNMVINNRLVRLCCEGCVKGVHKDPLAVFAKLDAAAPKKKDAVASSGPRDVSFGGVTTVIPGHWTETEPSSNMRLANYTVASDKGAAEAIVFYFGEQGAGGVEANIARWVGQFPGADRPEVKTFEVGGMEVTYLEIRGAYQGMGAASPKADQMACRAIVEGPEGPLYLNLTGDRAAVEANLDAYHKLLRSMKKSR